MRHCPSLLPRETFLMVKTNTENYTLILQTAGDAGEQMQSPQLRNVTTRTIESCPECFREPEATPLRSDTHRPQAITSLSKVRKRHQWQLKRPQMRASTERF